MLMNINMFELCNQLLSARIYKSDSLLVVALNGEIVLEV
jgi:hypothetical protein